MSSAGRTYEAAGVSLALAEGVVSRLRTAVESTGAEGFGAFAGIYPLDDRRLLVATTDGVGSKLVLSRRAGKLRNAGRDLAAHCIDDVITTGAEPLFLLDYVAAHELDLEQVAALVEAEQARLGLVDEDRDDHLVVEIGGAPDDVQMTIGHRIE